MCIFLGQHSTIVVMKPKIVLLVWLIFLHLYHKCKCQIPSNVTSTKETTRSCNTGRFADLWFSIMCIVFTLLKLTREKRKFYSVGAARWKGNSTIAIPFEKTLAGGEDCVWYSHCTAKDTGCPRSSWRAVGVATRIRTSTFLTWKPWAKPGQQLVSRAKSRDSQRSLKSFSLRKYFLFTQH